ncbi:MAG: hypothetical protein IPM29_31295 [Planctomycetes bacterium]|nr:hypothetical protein [Planctomycetota bacterium]
MSGALATVRGLALFALTLALGCRALTRETLPDGAPAVPVDAEQKTATGLAHWRARPRTVAEVAAAWAELDAAARATPAGDPHRYERLTAAARCAIWLARHGGAAYDARTFGEAALVLTNTAVEDAPDRAEAYYLRAVAAGVVAQADEMQGMDAMQRIRDDARRAAELDPAFEGGGPHRVLGGLYLESPAPPVGVGSLRRALQHLRTGVELAPEHPGNLVFLARAERRNGADSARVGALLDRAERALATVDDDAERAYWAAELAAERAAGR